MVYMGGGIGGVGDMPGPPNGAPLIGMVPKGMVGKADVGPDCGGNICDPPNDCIGAE